MATTSTGMVGRTTPTATFCNHVGGGQRSLAAKGDALLVGDQLGVELGDGDRLHACCNRRDDGLVVNVEAHEDVRDKFLIIQLAARRCHLIGESLHLRVVLGQCRGSFRRHGEGHPSRDNAGPGLGGMLPLNRGLECGRGDRR